MNEQLRDAIRAMFEFQTELMMVMNYQVSIPLIHKEDLSAKWENAKMAIERIP